MDETFSPIIEDELPVPGGELTEILQEYVENYSKFVSAVDALGILGIENSRDRLNFPNYLGGLKWVAPFKFSMLDESGGEREYVARVNSGLDPKEAPMKAQEQAEALALGKGVVGLEQMLAYSPDPPVIISEYVSGTTFSKLTKDNPDFEYFRGIPKSHWEQLRSTIQAASERGILIDGDLSNVLYDENTGFTIIDYLKYDPSTSQEFSLQQINEEVMMDVITWSHLSTT